MEEDGVAGDIQVSVDLLAPAYVRSGLLAVERRVNEWANFIDWGVMSYETCLYNPHLERRHVSLSVVPWLRRRVRVEKSCMEDLAWVLNQLVLNIKEHTRGEIESKVRVGVGSGRVWVSVGDTGEGLFTTLRRRGGSVSDEDLLRGLLRSDLKWLGWLRGFGVLGVIDRVKRSGGRVLFATGDARFGSGEEGLRREDPVVEGTAVLLWVPFQSP